MSVAVNISIKLHQTIHDISFVNLWFKAEGLKKKDWIGSSDPYFTINVPTKETVDRVKKSEEGVDKVLEVYEKLSDIQEYFEQVLEVSSSLADAASTVVESIAISPVLPIKMALWGIKIARKTHEVPKGYKEIYKSEVVKNNVSPQWAQFQKGFYELSYSDISFPILLQFWDWDRFGRSDCLGECCITGGHILLAHKRWVSIDVTDSKKKVHGKLSIYSVVSNPEALLKKHNTIIHDHVPIGYNPEKKQTVIEKSFGMFSHAVSVANTKFSGCGGKGKIVLPFSKIEPPKKEGNFRRAISNPPSNKDGGQTQPNSNASPSQPQGYNTVPNAGHNSNIEYSPVYNSGHNTNPNTGHNPVPNIVYSPPPNTGYNTVLNIGYNSPPNTGHNPVLNVGYTPVYNTGQTSLPNTVHNPSPYGGYTPVYNTGQNSLPNTIYTSPPNTGDNPSSYGEYNPSSYSGHNPSPYGTYNPVPYGNPIGNTPTGGQTLSPYGGFQGGTQQPSYSGYYHNQDVSNTSSAKFGPVPNYVKPE